MGGTLKAVAPEALRKPGAFSVALRVEEGKNRCHPRRLEEIERLLPHLVLAVQLPANVRN